VLARLVEADAKTVANLRLYLLPDRVHLERLLFRITLGATLV
jgi:hypothetical protein